MNKLPPLPFAVFDEFGNGADDRVQDYGKACAAAAVAAALAPVTKPTKHYQPQRWPFALAHDHERQEVTGLSIPETPDA